LSSAVVRPHLRVSSAFGGRDLELMNGLVFKPRCDAGEEIRLA
jgi:hypothetical protein